MEGRIALAAQGTLENFLGSLNLFADRPGGGSARPG